MSKEGVPFLFYINRNGYGFVFTTNSGNPHIKIIA